LRLIRSLPSKRQSWRLFAIVSCWAFMGLLLSEILLLLVIQAPLAQLRRLAQLLPLLAENQYQQLRARLPILGRSPIPP
jgi:hypothetical protein